MASAATITGLAPFVPAGPDLDIALDFYERKLGFTRVWREGGYAGLKRGAAELILQQYDDRKFAENFMYAVKVQNIQQLYEEYQKSGVTLGKLEMKPWGAVEFHVIDPAGVCIHFRKVD
jgi:catechol 2,3-dioxygenase-like lactoylglutathione lyase family enzyme